MKYCLLIMDGAAGLPLPGSGKTCLELANIPNLDAMANEGALGLVRTVPVDMEASSACACMSALGYDPKVYYRGRAGIEARSIGIPIEEGEVVFRCNLVAIRDGKMFDYSAGHISTAEAKALIVALNKKLGNNAVTFYPGVSYRHICKLKGREDTLRADCTPPHDIPGQSIDKFLPHGPGSDFLRELMERSVKVLREHPVNSEREETEATMIWLFWGSGRAPEMPAFEQVFGIKAAMTSGVDLLNGLAQIVGMKVLAIPGVTDGQDNDYTAQGRGALAALEQNDLVVVHIEAPDEVAHRGFIDQKVEAIQRIDGDVVGQLRSRKKDGFRVLIMPDHPTPISIRTHSPDPVPFLMWGEGFVPNGAKRFTETEAKKTGLFIDPGYNIMYGLIGKREWR
jgi:2,3-bisphosphoglycerate-independent phosphoglycerate mutase